MEDSAWFGALITGNFEQLASLAPRMAGTRTHLGETALMTAVRTGDNRAVRLLEPFESTLKNTEGESALMLAVRFSNEEATCLLANREYWVTKDDGTTALHIAVSLGNRRIIEALAPYLRNTADKSGLLPDIGPQTPPRKLDGPLSPSLTPAPPSLPAVALQASQIASSVLPCKASTLHSSCSTPSSHSQARQDTRPVPRSSPRVRIEMVTTDASMLTAYLEESPALPTTLELAEAPGSLVESDQMGSPQTQSMELLSEVSSAKRMYSRAQLQAQSVLQCLESFDPERYLILRFLASRQHLAPRPIDRDRAMAAVPLLLINPFPSTMHIANVFSAQSNLASVQERITSIIEPGRAAPLPCILFSSLDALVSAVVPFLSDQSPEAIVSGLAVHGVYAMLLPARLAEKYTRFVASFAVESLPPAGDLFNTRYVCVHGATQEDIYSFCRRCATICKIYAVEDAAAPDPWRVEVMEHERVSGMLNSSKVVIRIADVSQAELLLLNLVFRDYDAYFLSFREIIDLRVPIDAFTE